MTEKTEKMEQLDNQEHTSTQPDSDWMDIHETAIYLKAKVSHIRDLVYRRQIPHTKLGRLLRFHRPTLDQWLLSKQRGG